MVRNRAGTDDVRAMYEAFPYPGPHDGPIYDVANNLAVLFPGQTLEGKRILDAGCGSGQRLLGAATRYPKAEFWGIDMTLASLDVARRAADRQSLGNVHLEQANLLDLHLSTTFDIIEIGRAHV